MSSAYSAFGGAGSEALSLRPKIPSINLDLPLDIHLSFQHYNSSTTTNATHEREVDYIDPITKGINRKALLHDKLIEDSKKEELKK